MKTRREILGRAAIQQGNNMTQVQNPWNQGQQQVMYTVQETLPTNPQVLYNQQNEFQDFGGNIENLKVDTVNSKPQPALERIKSQNFRINSPIPDAVEKEVTNIRKHQNLLEQNLDNLRNVVNTVESDMKILTEKQSRFQSAVEENKRLSNIVNQKIDNLTKLIRAKQQRQVQAQRVPSFSQQQNVMTRTLPSGQFQQPQGNIFGQGRGFNPMAQTTGGMFTNQQ